MSRPRTQIGPCSVDGCETASYSKGVCRLHYNRVWRRGTPHAGELRYEFEQRVEKTEGCWIWRGAYFKSGYGRVSCGAKKRKASRVAHELYIGPIPEGLHVLHRCDNPACVNPAHLWAGTHIENMRDMEAKGRAKWIQANLRGKKACTDSARP